MATVMFDPSTGVTTSIGDTGDRFTGLAFDSAGILYAVTGDGAGVLETLYTLGLADGSPTLVATLGSGNDGETIAFTPDDDLTYFASGEGVPNVNEIFGTFDPSSSIIDSITIRG